MLTFRHLGLLAQRSAVEFLDDHCTQMAAAISYYVLFSLFPLLIFFVGIVGLLLQDSALQDRLIDAVLDYIPLDQEEGRNDVAEAVRGVAGVGSGAVGLLGLIGMAWSGSNMFAAIRRSLNTAWDLDRRRPIVRQKLIDFAMMLLLGPFFALSIASTWAIRLARGFVEGLPIVGGIAEAGGPGWGLLAAAIPVVLSFAGFLALYCVLPATRVTFRDAWPGALLAAVLFEGAKVGFTVYLDNFANYEVVFGSLGTVVAFLFWVYISANILLLGAEVASEYPRVMRGDYDNAVPDRRPFREKARDGVRKLFFSE